MGDTGSAQTSGKGSSWSEHELTKCLINKPALQNQWSKPLLLNYALLPWKIMHTNPEHYFKASFQNTLEINHNLCNPWIHFNRENWTLTRGWTLFNQEMPPQWHKFVLWASLHLAFLGVLFPLLFKHQYSQNHSPSLVGPCSRCWMDCTISTSLSVSWCMFHEISRLFSLAYWRTDTWIEELPETENKHLKLCMWMS